MVRKIGVSEITLYMKQCIGNLFVKNVDILVQIVNTKFHNERGKDNVYSGCKRRGEQKFISEKHLCSVSFSVY